MPGEFDVRFLTVAEVASMMRVSKMTVYRLVHGGTLPAVMNAANEVAVAAFLNRHLRFPQIWETVAHVMDRHRTVAHPDLDAILAADQWARAEATAAIGKK